MLERLELGIYTLVVFHEKQFFFKFQNVTLRTSEIISEAFHLHHLLFISLNLVDISRTIISFYHHHPTPIFRNWTLDDLHISEKLIICKKCHKRKSWYHWSWTNLFKWNSRFLILKCFERGITKAKTQCNLFKFNVMFINLMWCFLTVDE